jgi:hypothetical protein
MRNFAALVCLAASLGAVASMAQSADIRDVERRWTNLATSFERVDVDAPERYTFGSRRTGAVRCAPTAIAAWPPTKPMMAGGPGFEPRLTESESAVLPLNYPPKATGQPAR